MFCFKSTIVLGFFSYTLLLRYPQRKKSQALRWEILQAIQYCSSWDHASWEHLVEELHCSPRSLSHCPILLNPESLGFNSKSLHLQFQKCVKHLSKAGWIYCYCPACLIFKEIGPHHPKDATPQEAVTFLECKGFWWISQGFLVAQQWQFWELTLPQRWKFSSFVMRTWSWSSLSRVFNRTSQTVFWFTIRHS